ncbi:MAG TPA: metallophosphoesterase family protein [Nitrososphaerales archaeon]|nr:metallophosphoesterase family protein [Nitrososphaerales archaeon]
MIIAQISDLHLGPQFVEDSYRKAVEEILELKPDVVVASGDFTENGLLREYRLAAKEMDALKGFPVITVAGNHDYRSTGYLIYKEIFGEKQINQQGGAVFFSVSTARPDRDEGEVGHRQNIWLEESLKKYEGKAKVVVMHHHVIQVPDTGTDRITIVDAGDVLKSLLAAGATLVLCGHRHRPWMWRINEMLIVHAGTVSSERTRGYFANTYNIIELNESTGEASVSLKLVGGRRIPMDEVVKERETYIPQI